MRRGSASPWMSLSFAKRVRSDSPPFHYQGPHGSWYGRPMIMPVHYRVRLAAAVGVLTLQAVLGVARAEPRAQSSVRGPWAAYEACEDAIQSAEQPLHLPAQLLGAIGLTESGRLIPQTGRIAPWPWTINVGGTGYFYDTKELAIAATRRFQASGEQSIDVGCMQVNLAYHPAAFASLDQAFDAASNVSYAAGFLTRLYAQSHDWAMAASAYHSQTPGVSNGYIRRVVAAWPMAARYLGQAALASLAAGEDVVTPSTRDEPRRVCGVADMSRYTAGFQKIIVQTALDHARLLRGLGRSDLAAATWDCGGRPQRTLSTRRWRSQGRQVASLQQGTP